MSECPGGGRHVYHEQRRIKHNGVITIYYKCDKCSDTYSEDQYT